MTAKEYMKQAKILLKRIERKRREAEDIRIRESTPSTSAFSDMPKTVTHNPHQKSDNILRAIELDHEADIAFDELAKLKSTFQESLQKIDNPDERDLMYKHYIEFKNWDIVFHEMGYSRSAGYRIHKQALSKL